MILQDLTPTIEYGVKHAVSRVLPNAIFPTGTTFSGSIGSEINSANYSYYYIETPIKNYCLIHATGTKGSSKVIKTAVIPRAGTQWGGLVTRGGSINLAGSSAIAGCDDEDSNYAHRCGIVPGVIYQAGNLNYTPADVSNPIIVCVGTGSLKGFEGNPPLQPTQLPNDLIPIYFGATDTNNNGSAWDELLTQIETAKNVEFYPSLPGTPIAPGPIPLSCQAPAGTQCCETSSNNVIRCFSNVNCTGVSTNIDLSNCTQNAIPYVSLGNATLNINQNDFNANIVSNTNVRITANIRNLTLSTGGAVFINSNLTTSGDFTNRIYAGGDINFSTTTNNLTMVNSNFLSGGTINVGTTGNARFDGSLTNSNFFANNLNFNLTSSSGVSGGIFYAVNHTTINTQGSLNFGTTTNPILLLAGKSQLSVPGDLTISGMVYTEATTISIKGSVELQGTLISASNSTINNTGNGTIQFNKRVLDALCNLFDGNPSNGICDSGGGS